MERIAANSCKHQSTATQGKCRAYKAAVRTSDKILLRLKQPSFDCSASSTATNPTLERALKNYESSKEVGGEEGILRSRIALAIFRDGVDQSMRAGKCKAGQTITSATFAAVAKETNIEHAKVARLYKYGKALTQLAKIESCLILILGKDTVLLYGKDLLVVIKTNFFLDGSGRLDQRLLKTSSPISRNIVHIFITRPSK